MKIKGIFVSTLIAVYLNQLNLGKEFNNLFKHERCVFVISDQSDVLDQIVLKSMQTSTIVNFNLSTFTKDNSTYYCTPSTYILITNNNEDIWTVVQDIILLRVHTKLITVSHGGLASSNLKKLGEIYFIRFIQIIHVILGDDERVEIANVTEPDEYNLDRKPLKVTLFEYVPYIYKRYETWKGIEVKILKHVAQGMTLEYVQYERRGWIDEVRNLGDNLADVSITNHWLSYVIEYGGEPTVQYASATLTFVVPRPEMLPVSTHVFQTLSTTVWAMIILSVLGFTITLHLVHKCKNLKNNPTYLIIVLSYLSMAPAPPKSKYFLLRLQMIVLALASMIISTMNSAGLSSIALVPRRFKAIETMRDLAESGVKCYTDETYLRKLLLESEFDSERQIGSRMVLSDVYIPDECQQVVILDDNAIVQTYQKLPDVEKLMLLTDYGHQTHNCIALARNSPYMNIFNKRLYQLIEHGFIRKWILEERLYLAPTEKYRGRGLQVSNKKQMLLTIAKLQGAFFLLLVGYFIAIGALLVEFQRIHICMQTLNF